MRLAEIYAAGFRCFSHDEPLKLEVRKGLNVLVGENDSGKTAIIDAVRLVLGTRGDEYQRIAIDDFHVDGSGRQTTLKIRCSFDELTEHEASSFAEWCTLTKATTKLHIVLTSSLQQLPSGAMRPYTQLRAGENGDGPPIEGVLREYIRTTYLRPLRDAETDLRAGRRSRLSQILSVLPDMHTQRVKSHDETGSPNSIAAIIDAADQQISTNAAIRSIEQTVNNEYLQYLSVGAQRLEARLGIGQNLTIGQILERLELVLKQPNALPEPVRRGLGLNNVLFMAAELLMLQSGSEQLPLLLIEEPEAHLHPQMQIRFLNVMQLRSKDAAHPVQSIVSTHSPIFASSLDLESMVLVASGRTCPLSFGQTMLDRSDYAFLRRFLDATKANLFFASGVLVVEGDGENLLLPAFASKLGRPLDRHGVSIVKVGHTGLFRYSRILRRKQGQPQLSVPVACIADRDIVPDEAKIYDKFEERKTLSQWTQAEIDKKLATLTEDAGDNVAVFVSGQWTLEYDLAHDGLSVELHQAISLVLSWKGDPAKRKAIMESARHEVSDWIAAGKSATEIAIMIYQPVAEKRASKAEVAQYLAEIITELPDDPHAFESRFVGLGKYLVDAIKYVTNV